MMHILIMRLREATAVSNVQTQDVDIYELYVLYIYRLRTRGLSVIT